MIYHVVAMANKRVIGKNNKLPWHFSSDLKFFKNLTMGQTILMGRKTFESVGKPLPGRENFILSKASHSERSEESRSFGPSDLRMTHKFFNSIEDAIKSIKTKDCFIIGGGKVFNESFTLIDGIYLTRIYADYAGDTHYPEIPSHFKEISKTLLQENPKIEVIYFKNILKTS